jgi:hypothetical protein
MKCDRSTFVETGNGFIVAEKLDSRSVYCKSAGAGIQDDERPPYTVGL